MPGWRLRLRRVWEKHRHELRGLVRGELPRWLAPGRSDAPLGEIPVFEFHDVEPAQFEAVLRFLKNNDYRSLTAGELVERQGRPVDGERVLVLSFDDALRRVRTVAFPLLQEYGFRGVLFVVPAVIADGDGATPDLTDVRAGHARLEDLRRHAAREPFCTWTELDEMRRAGVFDVQSHSLSHHRVPVSPRVLDFVHPGLDLWYGNFDLPVSSLDEGLERAPRLGAPLFDSAPRLSGRPAFRERPELVQALLDRVVAAGPEFFERSSWRRELRDELRSWPLQERGAYEPDTTTREAVRREIAEARDLLEARLPGAEVRYLAYPWEIGGRMADEEAGAAGVRAVFYGPTLPADRGDGPLRVRRLPESYVVRLPGRGRASFAGLIRRRMSRFRRAEEEGR